MLSSANVWQSFFGHYRLINGWHMTSLLLWRLRSIVSGEANGTDRHRNGVNFIFISFASHFHSQSLLHFPFSSVISVVFLLLISNVYRFLMRFTKDEGEINLATGEADPEFAEWKWANPEEVIEQVSYKNMTRNEYFVFLHLED